MTQRELVLSALAFERPRPTPYHIDLTGAMRDQLAAHTGSTEFAFEAGNAIAAAELIAPQVRVGPERDRDEFGVVWNKSGADKDIGVIDEILLKDYADLNSFALPPIDEAMIHAALAPIEAQKDKFRVGQIGFSLFERAWTLRGMENLLADMLLEPEFVHELLDQITERNLRLIDVALRHDLDAIYFGDDWGQQQGLIMGPRCWRAFIKPCLARMYAKVRGAGKFVVQHSCGDIREIMDELIELGLNVYQTYQPEIYGPDHPRTLRNRLTICGGISTQRDLPTKSPAQVAEITRALLAAFPDGGLIAGPTHAVPPDVPPENLLAMLDALQNQ